MFCIHILWKRFFQACSPLRQQVSPFVWFGPCCSELRLMPLPPCLMILQTSLTCPYVVRLPGRRALAYSAAPLKEQFHTSDHPCASQHFSVVMCHSGDEATGTTCNIRDMCELWTYTVV